MANSLKDLMSFFSTKEKPVTAGEFQSFWKSCTKEEQEYYKSAELV